MTERIDFGKFISRENNRVFQDWIEMLNATNLKRHGNSFNNGRSSSQLSNQLCELVLERFQPVLEFRLARSKLGCSSPGRCAWLVRWVVWMEMVRWRHMHMLRKLLVMVDLMNIATSISIHTSLRGGGSSSRWQSRWNRTTNTTSSRGWNESVVLMSGENNSLSFQLAVQLCQFLLHDLKLKLNLSSFEKIKMAL